MTDISERSLADVPAEPQTEQDPQVVDSTQDVKAEDFNFADFVAGARPTRRAALLYMRADLVGALEELVQRIEEAHAEEDEDLAAELEAKAGPLWQEFHDSGRWFHVEKRSSEWERKFRADKAAELGITLDKDGATTNREDGVALSLAQTAAQLVIPSNATAEGLRRLYDTNEHEVTKLFLAVRMANSEMAESVRVVGPDFSPKPSTSRATPGS